MRADNLEGSSPEVSGESPSGVSIDRLQACIRSGAPLALGEHLPAWNPFDGGPPPPELTVSSSQLRQVLLDPELGSRADPRGLTVRGAIIVGELDLDFATVTFPLRLLCCRVTGSLKLSYGKLRELILSGTHLQGIDREGRCLAGDGLDVSHDLHLDKGFTAAGAIRLRGAYVGGQINLDDAALRGADSEGHSLRANGLQAKNNVLVRNALTSVGGIMIAGAHVGGKLDFSGTTLDGCDIRGNSLAADGLLADNTLALGDGFSATGVIRLPRARIGGYLDFSDASLKGADRNGDSLVGEGLQANNTVLLTGRFTAAGRVNFAAARITSLVVGASRDSLPKLGDITGWRLGDVHGVIRDDRSAAAAWLSQQSAAQPWQELADVYARNGQPTDARWMRYRSAVNSTRNARLSAKLSRQAYRLTTGHGYYPGVALAWLAVIFCLSFTMAYFWRDTFTTQPTAVAIPTDPAGHHETSTTGHVTNAQCTPAWKVACLDPLAFALSSTFPGVAEDPSWDPPDNGWMPLLFFFLRLAAWMFTAVLLAGITGLLHKQT
ncbi:hypothetical protein SAMN05421678_11176 [Actinopolymorpha cephalotaxi]|uniref:Pentapeptide repeat-containing protein n=1 Tax=Actinopolymorpha cephalotaxi TaxID=504797 RepID=A0A1I2WV00_9ACTN|nr:hypothetical protein [Actinopolymorpha cephalotaxi]NYH85104.1 hypothetical protein [Actinopolymorpha cephalotaxi]SFH04216.1 hypothetical protein SAMN05421678_11176 [Actinopolymorpha cephalotaxi]